MSIQSQARTAFAYIKTAHPSLVVPVVSAGQAADGVMDTSTKTSDGGANGEKGIIAGKVRCDASEITQPEYGATITVNGAAVFVMSSSLDPAGAILTIEYQEQRPVEVI